MAAEHRSKAFGLFKLPTKNELMVQGAAFGGGLAAVIGYEAGLERLPIPARLRPWMPLGEILAGSILGPMIALTYPDAGMGAGVGLAVSGAKRMLQSMSSTASLFPGNYYAPAATGTAGFGATETTDAVLLGESSVDVEDVDNTFGDSPVEVEDVDSTFGNASYY